MYCCSDSKQNRVRKFGVYLGLFRDEEWRRSTMSRKPLSTFLTHQRKTAIRWLGRQLPNAFNQRMSFFRSLALLSLAGCSLATDPLAPEGSTKVLFIGSSLIDAHDLPVTVAQLASSAGQPECYCISIAYQDYELDDHFALGDALEALQAEDWDFVVLQQGPSAHPASRARLMKGVSDFAKLITERGARTILYMPWPARDSAFYFPAVRESYRFAADSIGVQLAPAGEAWLLAWARDATLPLYGPNGYYPSEMGSYLAALVIFQRIYSRSPVGVQAPAVVNGTTQPWPVVEIQLLQEAAAAANAAEDQREHVPPTPLNALPRFTIQDPRTR